MKLAVALLLLLFSACAAPANPSFGGEQWARTPIARGNPEGVGMAMATTTGTGAFVLRRMSDGARQLWPLPLQVKVTITGTAAFTMCASQDPTPIISRQGRFSADSAGYYAAGQGPCLPMYINDFFGIDRVAFISQRSPDSLANSLSGGNPIGSKPYQCSISGEPCNQGADCSVGGGNCTTLIQSTNTYLFIIAEAGSGVTALAGDAR